MRRLDLAFAALLLPLDFLALLGAAVSAYALRFSPYFIGIRPIITEIPFPQYLASATGFALLWMLLFAMAGLYSMRQRRAWNTLGRVFISCLAGIMLLIAIVFFSRALDTSRFVIAAVFGFAVIYVSLARLALRAFRRILFRGRIGHEQIALVGSSRAAMDIAMLYKQHPELGWTIVKQYKTWNEATKKDLRDLASKHKIDTVLLAEPELNRTDALELIGLAEEFHLGFRYLADLFSATFTNVEMDTFGGVPVISVKRTKLDGWGRIFKRLFDIVASSILILITSPLIIFSTIALWIEDGLPVFFLNERVGERGNLFRLMKLRSMWRRYSIGPQFKKQKAALKIEQELIKEKSIKEGPVYKIADDPRVTPVGHFIRRWSIDELPQFINVFKGDMSLVGPRPHQPREVANYLPHHRRVLAIKPGITGLAQISGRSDLDFEDEVRLDAWYIENWSPALDLYILIKTPMAVINKKGAY
ncbi:sugar transferase [Candidatus Uhrbacteria bacterium]|nr:MAG: sugar transferase [Candidatus Uhrbacteria bacterium]